MLEKIYKAAEFIESIIKYPPDIGMITGTGLGNLTGRMIVDNRIAYKDIPYFPVSTVIGHDGFLVAGTISRKRVLAMEGRFHLYEGYSPSEITFPIRIMKKLGAKYLFISSAAGGFNPMFKAGDLMVVDDHINFTGIDPLTGPNLDEFGPRFLDMSRVYDPGLILIAKNNAMKLEIDLKQGVYMGITGPCLETPSEVRFMRMLGADAVGMSTVHEVIVAKHCGLKIMAIVVITDMDLPDCMEEVKVEKVIKIAKAASPLLSALWESVIKELP
ncbi:MAG: purine-nucleoside phosphorylase [Deltaproteobacteria bacterium]|nr:purine-nucleoside phosphorylase [Deltaproteobacteria bacterium]